MNPPERPKCPKCKSGNILFHTDKTFYCRRCGYNSREDKKE